MAMKIAYLHTNPNNQEIEDLILDITANYKSNDIQIFEIKYVDFKLYRIYDLIKIRKFLKDNKIDIIHTYHYKDAYYALKVSFGLDVKIVFSCYSYYSTLNAFSKRMFKKVLLNADAVIFQTETQKDRFISEYENHSSKFFKLYHAYSHERMDNYNYESVRDEFFIDDLRYLIGTLGDFSPEHDIMNILKMVKKLRRTGRNFTCVISGGIQEIYDTYFDECKYYYLIQGLDNYITYTGNRKDHANYLSQLDAFVYHSDDEAIALPIIEAMIMGINVVVNDNEMIKEITRNGKYATLYKTKDVVDFAEKTRNVLLELDDYKIIAETVKEECREIFSIEKHILGLQEIYKQIKK